MPFLDILFNLMDPEKSKVLGEKITEEPLPTARIIYYEETVKPTFLWNWILPPAVSDFFGLRAGKRDVPYMTALRDRSIEEKVMSIIPDVTCPACGESYNIRLLCGGSVSVFTDNPPTPQINFGDWVSYLRTQEDPIRRMSRMQEELDKLNIEVIRLRPFERVVIAKDEEIIALKELKKQYEFDLQKTVKAENAARMELGQIYSYIETKLHITPKDIADAAATAEAVSFGGRQLSMKEKWQESELARMDERTRADALRRAAEKEDAVVALQREVAEMKRGRERARPPGAEE